MKNLFSYLEIVKVQTEDPEFKEFNGKKGAIISLPEDREIDINYGLYTDDDREPVIICPEEYLVSTGKYEIETNIWPGADKNK